MHVQIPGVIIIIIIIHQTYMALFRILKDADKISTNKLNI